MNSAMSQVRLSTSGLAKQTGSWFLPGALQNYWPRFTATDLLNAAAAGFAAFMNPFALLTPLFLAFEFWQLIVSERYMGIKQIRVNADPRELPMAGWMSALWGGGLLVYYGWMITLLFHPVGRAQGVVLLLVTGLGYAFRSSCGLKWVLVVLTFEGSIRVGMLISLIGMSWRALMRT